MVDPLFALVSYILGAIPAAYVVTRALGVDISRFGDRNIGAVNAYYATGRLWVFLVVLLYDAGKAFVTTYFFGPIYGLITIFGHIFSVFTWIFLRRPVSGAGTASMIGFALAFDWRLVPIAIAFAAVYYLLMRPGGKLFDFFRVERGYTVGMVMLLATSSTYSLFFPAPFEKKAVLYAAALFVSAVYAYKLRTIYRNWGVL